MWVTGLHFGWIINQINKGSILWIQGCLASQEYLCPGCSALINAHECVRFCHSWLIRLTATCSPHMAFRHPATALSLALFLFNLVHSLNLLKSLKLWIFIIHHTVSPFQVHVSLPSVSSFKPLITGYERTGPKCCATHSGSPPGLTGTLGTVFQWPETHPVVLSPSPCSPFVQKDIIRNLLRCPAEIQIHCICSISWGKSLIWSIIF